jgi:glycine oxidase
VKTWDAVIIGGGVIGLSLALELRRCGMSVMVLEKHQPGREASWAAGGMIADAEAGSNAAFRQLAKVSAQMYPAFAHQLHDESGIEIDLRDQGTIRFLDDDNLPEPPGTPLSAQDLRQLEPELEYAAPASFIAERCVDPRLLIEALVGAARHLGVDIASGSEVIRIETFNGRVTAAVTTKSLYPAGVVVNCAGAWAGEFSPVPIPLVPIKGQMLAIAPCPIKHVVRGNGVYLIPRSNGRLVIGATVEDVGFDKRVHPDSIQRMHQAAAILAPSIGQLRILEDWAGLRPRTPDGLPIMSGTTIDRYFVSAGHYRDGIMLAPVSAKLMAQIIRGDLPQLDIREFLLARLQA